MYFLNLVWLEDPAGSGDRHAVLFMLLSHFLSPCIKLPKYSILIRLCTEASATYLQAAAFLVFPHNIS